MAPPTTTPVHQGSHQSDSEESVVPNSPAPLQPQGRITTAHRTRDRTRPRTSRNRSRPIRRHRRNRQRQSTTDNPYVVVLVPPGGATVTPSRTDPNNNPNQNSPQDGEDPPTETQFRRCIRVGRTALKMVSKIFYITCCECFPWVIGSILIYYSYQHYGLPVALSIFVFLASTQGIIRWVRTKSNYSKGCFQRPVTPNRVRRTSQAPQVMVTVDNQASDETTDSDQSIREEEERIPEPPPSYEAITLSMADNEKHLVYHLTPTRPRQIMGEKIIPSPVQPLKSTLAIPSALFVKQGTPAPTDDEDDDFVFLPSYFDAARRESMAKEKEGKDTSLFIPDEDVGKEDSVTVNDLDEKSAE